MADRAVIQFPHNKRTAGRTGQVDRGGGGSDDGGMNHEKRLTTIETILPTLMTKSDGEALRTDLHKMDASIKAWMIVTIIGLFLGFGGLFFTMSNFLKPTAASSAHQAPIIINIPPAGAPATSEK